MCSVSVYYFPTEDDDEDGPTFKDKAIEFTKQAIDVLCIWDCCTPWVKLTELMAFIVFDPFVELFITLCIVVNTLFMALDHHDMDKPMEKVLKSGNYVSNQRPFFFRIRTISWIAFPLSVFYRNLRH
jgi:voltage-gated sodium channel type II alpha